MSEYYKNKIAFNSALLFGSCKNRYCVSMSYKWLKIVNFHYGKDAFGSAILSYFGRRGDGELTFWQTATDGILWHIY